MMYVTSYRTKEKIDYLEPLKGIVMYLSKG